MHTARSRSSWPASIAASTSAATSCPASATPATACTAPSRGDQNGAFWPASVARRREPLGLLVSGERCLRIASAHLVRERGHGVGEPAVLDLEHVLGVHLARVREVVAPDEGHVVA